MYVQAANRFTTVRDLLRFAVSRFNHSRLNYGHGTTNAYDEAVYLILSSLHLPIDQLDPFLDAHLLPDEIQRVIEIIEKRTEQRIPTAYLIHEAWQGEFNFYVDERVIVPRSFIFELLGEPLLPWVKQPEHNYRILDLCTGSGCLAIQIAHHYPNAMIDAVDISLDALEVAAINVENYGLQDRIQLIHSDLFLGLEEKYDLIVSNPPYVDQKSIDELPPEYQHEPELALGSGIDGLNATRDILYHASQFLSENGVLLVEIGNNRDALEHAFPRLPFMWIETSGGDGFVFLLTHEDLVAAGLGSA